MVKTATRKRPPSIHTLKVLGYMLQQSEVERYGLEIIRATGLTAGALYPILKRSVERGWFTNRWENIDQSEEGRKRRRYYRVVPDKVNELRELVDAESRALLTLLGTPV